MSDFKSKLPDLKEISSMMSKLFNGLKDSVEEIIQDYKKKRTTGHTASHPRAQETHKTKEHKEQKSKSTKAKKSHSDESEQVKKKSTKQSEKNEKSSG